MSELRWDGSEEVEDVTHATLLCLDDAPRNTYSFFQASFCGAGEAVVCAFARVRKRAPSRESVGRDARSEYLAFRLVGFENGSVARKKQRLFRSRRFRHTRARDARSLDADTPALAPELALDDPRARST